MKYKDSDYDEYGLNSKDRKGLEFSANNYMSNLTEGVLSKEYEKDYKKTKYKTKAYVPPNQRP